MQKKFFLISILGLALILAACAPAATPTQDLQANPSANGAGNGNGGGNGNPTRTLNADTKMEMGILKLEGTTNAVTADEAKTLLPLFQKVKTMMADANPAPTDLQAVYTQIQGDLTSDQTSAIDQMNLTQADMQSMMQQLGITFPQGGANGGTPFPTQSADQRATRTAQRQTQAASGSGNGGYPAPNGTPGAGFRGGGRGGFGNVFIDPIINLLQTRAGG